MSYIKQNVQSTYETSIFDIREPYLLALKDFLISNGFVFISENYGTENNLVMSFGDTQYFFKADSNSYYDTASVSIKISKTLSNGTTIDVAGASVPLKVYKYTNQNKYSIASTVFIVKNQNSFALIITSSDNSITTSSNAITGNIAYKLLNGTDSDISFVNDTSFWTAEKLQGNPVTFRMAHNKLNDDRLVYENKVSISQSGIFVGESNEIIGLVGAEKGKIYQTDKGKYFAFANDIAMLMGDEIL